MTDQREPADQDPSDPSSDPAAEPASGPAADRPGDPAAEPGSGHQPPAPYTGRPGTAPSYGEPTYGAAPPPQAPTHQWPPQPPAGQQWPGQQWPGQQWPGQPAYGPMVPRADQRQIPGSKRDAIWAIVLACVPCCLITQVVSIVLGVKVLRRSRGEVDHGRTLATIALCIAGLMIAGTVAGWGIRLFAPQLLDDLGEPTRTEEGQLAEEGDVSSFAVQVGDCLVDLQFESDGPTEFRSVPGVPCAEEHGFEAYHAFDLDQGRYPGLERIEQEAVEGCLDAFKDFVGLSYRRSILELTWLYPTETSWNLRRDREVVCFITDPEGRTTGSLEGSRR